MDFWTFSQYARKTVRVVLKNGQVVKGWIYYQIIDFSARPVWVKEFRIMKDDYSSEKIVCSDIEEICFAEESVE